MQMSEFQKKQKVFTKKFNYPFDCDSQNLLSNSLNGWQNAVLNSKLLPFSVWYDILFRAVSA